MKASNKHIIIKTVIVVIIYSGIRLKKTSVEVEGSAQAFYSRECKSNDFKIT